METLLIGLPMNNSTHPDVTPLRALEDRILLLENRAQPRGLRHFITSNWAIFSFLAAVAVAVYARYVHDIEFFEQYRNAGTLKQVSRYYSAMGDRLVESQEWEAAGVAYKRALEVNPHNLDAQVGRLKAEVFDPLPGRQYTATEVADARLRYMEELFPEDDQILFLRAVADQSRGATADAEKQLLALLEKRPDFAAAHQMLGILYQNAWRIDDAVGAYQQAAKFNPRMAAAHNNLGYCHLLKLQVKTAIQELSRALQLSAYAVTALNLGDAYRYAGELQTAHQMHELVYANVVRLSNVNERERFIEGQWTYNFMPLRHDDKETIKRYILVYSLPQKQAVTRLALAIDLGLLQQYAAADRELLEALKLDGSTDYRQFYANRLQSARNLVGASFAVNQWLDSRTNAVLTWRP